MGANAPPNKRIPLRAPNVLSVAIRITHPKIEAAALAIKSREWRMRGITHCAPTRPTSSANQYRASIRRASGGLTPSR